MSVRSYADADLPVLQATVAGWIAEAGRCGYDHIGELPHRIYENLRGRWPLGEVVRVWEDGDGIAGLAITMRFGVAFDVLAAPALRGREAEREMLRTAFELTARLMGDGAPFVLTDVWDCDAARIGLLAELGFEHFRNWEHVRERGLDGPLPEAQAGRDFELRCAGPADAGQLAAVRNDCFGETWTGEQYLSQVMGKPGYEPSREIVAVAPDGRIAAFAVYWPDLLNRTGHFEPVGAHSDFRGRGLARAVMLRAMRDMRDLGMTCVTVNHLGENAPARKLYESIGFVRKHETLGFRRPLTGQGTLTSQS
jgi:ribosomal protein S18 acetylase RimI-like enzyme